MTASVRQAEVLVWQLIRETVMNHLDVRRAEVSERLGMSFFKAKALRRLTTGPLTMGELTSSLSTDAPYTSLLVQDLVSRGLVVRITHGADRRRKVVELTTSGRQVAEIAEEILDRPPPVFAELADSELSQLSHLFARLA